MTDTTTERVRKSTDEKLADALAQLQARPTAEKSLEQEQREQAADYLQGVLAAALINLGVEAYTGESRDLIAKAASSLARALASGKAAIKAVPAAELIKLPGVTQ